MEVYPMYYTAITRSQHFRISFQSACMDKIDVNFEVYHKDYRLINWNYHPTKVNLVLWDVNHYILSYGKPVEIDKFDIMKSLEYQKLNVTNTSEAGKNDIDLMFRNSIFLNP